MIRRAALAGALILLIATSASAHRLDEYLQATTFLVGTNRIQGEIRLTPGVAVFSKVFSGIDSNHDGTLSAAEEQEYAARVLGDLSLTVGLNRLALRLTSWKFAATDEMKEGRGEIQIDFEANVPDSGHNRKMVFENHHQTSIAAYLVNCLVPSDPNIQVTGQSRNYQQSHYELDYNQGGSSPLLSDHSRHYAHRTWMTAVALLLIAPLSLLRRRNGLRRRHPVAEEAETHEA